MDGDGEQLFDIGGRRHLCVCSCINLGERIDGYREKWWESDFFLETRQEAVRQSGCVRILHNHEGKMMMSSLGAAAYPKRFQLLPMEASASQPCQLRLVQTFGTHAVICMSHIIDVFL